MKKLILIISLITFNASAKTVTHNFGVSLGVFDAFETTFEYGIEDNSYHTDSFVETQGTLGLLYPFKVNYKSKGQIVQESLSPQSYRYDSQSRFNKRSRELFYDAFGNPTHRISTKNGKPHRVDIKKTAKNKGAIDLQSAFTKLALQYNALRFCDSRMPVFDGKKRFDVIFNDEGKEELQTPHFKGYAHKCSMYIDSLGAKGDDLLWELTLNKPVTFWIMKDAQTNVNFIAKVIVPGTALGDLEVVTKKISVK